MYSIWSIMDSIIQAACAAILNPTNKCLKKNKVQVKFKICPIVFE